MQFDGTGFYALVGVKAACVFGDPGGKDTETINTCAAIAKGYTGEGTCGFRGKA